MPLAERWCRRNLPVPSKQVTGMLVWENEDTADLKLRSLPSIPGQLPETPIVWYWVWKIYPELT